MPNPNASGRIPAALHRVVDRKVWTQPRGPVSTDLYQYGQGGSYAGHQISKPNKLLGARGPTQDEQPAGMTLGGHPTAS